MGRRFWLVIGAIALTIPFAGGALASIPPDPAEDEGMEQHGGTGGHLPASSDNVQLVGKLRLATQPGGISDVAALGNFAYVNTWAPECREFGGGGTGVHVVDISNPAAPVEVAFLESPNNAYVSEGVHAFHAETPFFSGDLLIHENEPCDSTQPAQLGISIWDITNPRAPVPLARHFGDNVPPGVPGINGVHHYHSVEGWWVPETGKAFAVASDNQDLDDIDIFDITDPKNPVQVADFGFNDFPAVARTPLAYGESVFFHDSDVKKIGSNWVLLTHYWDSGTQQWNVNNPASPTLISDFDYKRPDPVSGQDNPEGNGHSGEFTADGKYFILNDEDFSPTRANCSVGATAIGCSEFGWTVPLATNFPGGFSGSTVFGGSGCEEDVDGVGGSDRAEVLANYTQAQTGADAIAFIRGVCFFSIKVETAELAGYDMAIVINNHAGSQGGLTPNAFFAGGQGSPVLGIASAVMIGHANGHELFNDPVAFSGADLPAKGTAGQTFGAAGGVFDAWGYNHLIDRVTGKEIGQYIVDEANDPAFAQGFGTLSVHEVATDPSASLAYFSYYDAGFRVAKFGSFGLREVGHFIDTGGNDFWGVEVTGVTSGGRRVIAASDRDFGLYLFVYTGR
jgi:hypothetical protein